MIVKPAIHWLNRDKDPDLIMRIRTILKAMKEHDDIYPSPFPSLAEIQTAVDNFADGLVATADGGRSATAIKKALRLTLTGLVRQLASYVTVACKGDLHNLMLSGFPTHKPEHQPVGDLSTPYNLKVMHGKKSGELLARINPVFGASSYFWQASTGNPSVVVQTLNTTATRATFTGLIRGQTYGIIVSAIGATGPSAWSGPVYEMSL